jgi:hypothetical protein
MECGATVDGKLEHLADGAEPRPVLASNVVTLSRAQTVAAGDHETRG